MPVDRVLHYRLAPMDLPRLPSPATLASAAANVVAKVRTGHLADLTPLPADVIHDEALRTLSRYEVDDPSPAPPVLLVPPLGAPALCFDLRRGCSLAEHLVDGRRRTYLVDYGPLAFSNRALGLERWVDDIIPASIARVSADAGGAPVHLVGWCMGGLFSLLATSAQHDLPVASVTAIASPFDIAAVPLVAPLRPLAQVTGGRILSSVYRTLGSIPAPIVHWAFQLSSFDKYVTKPLAIAAHLGDRDFLEQIEAVDNLMANMYAYPGRAFGQIYHLMLRANDLKGGGIDLGGRTISLRDLDKPALLVAGEGDGIAPVAAVRAGADALTGSPDVRFEIAPGGHLGVLTGRQARATTWMHLDAFLRAHDLGLADHAGRRTSARRSKA